MRLRWRAKGGIAAVAGWLLVFIGVVSAFVDLGESELFISWINATWLPEPPLVVTYSFALLIVSAADAGGGVLLIGFARGERDREEELLLDPLRYAPFRHRWRKSIPWCALVVLVLVLPSLWIMPIEHSFQDEFAVSECFVGAPHDVNLPSGAVLTYQWSSSNGQPIGEVYAPSGPRANYPTSDVFYNSSFGYSVVQSDGTPIQFWACDFTLGGPVNNTVDLVGIYFTSIF